MGVRSTWYGERVVNARNELAIGLMLSGLVAYRFLPVAALPSIDKERWVSWVREADVLLADGGVAHLRPSGKTITTSRSWCGRAAASLSRRRATTRRARWSST